MKITIRDTEIHGLVKYLIGVPMLIIMLFVVSLPIIGFFTIVSWIIK